MILKSRHLIFSLSLVILLGLTPLALAQVNDGLVLYFPFDEAPVGNVVKDHSGLGNDGTLDGPSFLPTGGRIGGAYQFDGVDDFIKVLQNATLNVGSGPEFTLSAWYNTSTTSNIDVQSPLLEWSPGPQGPSGKAGVHMWVNTYGEQWHFPYGGNGGTGANLVATGVPFPQNEYDYVISTTDKPRDEWHHLAVTYDRINGVARVYVDGALGQERTFTITPDTDHDLYLGIRPTDYQRLNGLLDEVRIYNRALNEQEVLALADAGGLGKVFQNFEDDNGSEEYGWTWDPDHVTLSRTTEEKRSGEKSWKIVSTTDPNVDHGGTGIQSQTERWHFNGRAERHDRLVFWIYANPSNNEPNNVAVKFFDHGNYTSGFEVWTTTTAKVQQWTKLSVLLTQLPSDFNFQDIDKIEFVNYYPGTYYLDDIQFVLEQRAYQGFEQDRHYQNDFPQTCIPGNPDSYDLCGWAWDGTRAVVNDNVLEGAQSWELTTTAFMGGTGIRSQEQRLCLPGECADITSGVPEQSFWHVDLDPAHLSAQGYDRISFWIYADSDNDMDINAGVQFFDNGTYHDEFVPVWSRNSAINGHWTQLYVPLDILPADFLLTDINKLQLQVYWHGTYHIDGIKATKHVPVIDQTVLRTGTMTWPRIFEAALYRVEESTTGSNGPWITPAFYTGVSNTHAISRLSPSWFRVRWQAVPTETNMEPFISDWSDVAYYEPLPVLLRQASLQIGKLELKPIPQMTLYEIQESAKKNGPWTIKYSGPVPPTLLNAAVNKWYRARGVIKNGQGVIINSTSWSPVLQYSTAVVKAAGTVLRDQNGTGEVVHLRGTNLGNALLIEPWMFYGVGNPIAKKPPEPGEPDNGYDPNVAILDDWMFRDILTTRFGAQATADLMKLYRDTYLQGEDFDNIRRAGLNVVRLPVYYRDIRELDANLNWVGTTYKFDHIDRLIELAADRGLYVLLDLHGAPGNQSAQDNSGRFDFNKLFKENQMVNCSGSNVTIGECYRRRTIDLWKAIAMKYKNNTSVVGYDLLNEPAGVGSPAVLWQLYDRLYDAIRPIDSKHLIVMEGLWPDPLKWPTVINDWDWLPNPSTYAWTNVAYQFHYYCWDCATGEPPVLAAEQITRQQNFLDGLLANDDAKQLEFNVPLMVGEFTGFGVREVWEDYLTRFNEHGISWTTWSYKTHDSPSEWGFYNHNVYDKKLPDIKVDSFEELQNKFKQFDAISHHYPNASLVDILKTTGSSNINQPPVLNPIGNKTVSENQLLTFTILATDANGQGIMYSAASLPAGASFDALQKRFTWTPGYNQSGKYQVIFSASDGILSDIEKVSITVKNVPVLVNTVSNAPDPFSPNGDGRLETTNVQATFNHQANWTLQIKSGATVIRTYTGSGTSANQAWDGMNTSGVVVASATYTYRMTATDSGGSTSYRSGTVVLDRTSPVVTNFIDAPDPFTSSTGQKTTIKFTLSELSKVTLSIHNSGGTLIKTLLSNSQRSGANSILWDGRNTAGVLVAPGDYTYELLVEDKAQNYTNPHPMTGTTTVAP